MPHKLLLADDSVTIQRVIELTFADEDMQVLAVGDGQQAIARIADRTARHRPGRHRHAQARRLRSRGVRQEPPAAGAHSRAPADGRIRADRSRHARERPAATACSSSLSSPNGDQSRERVACRAGDPAALLRPANRRQRRRHATRRQRHSRCQRAILSAAAAVLGCVRVARRLFRPARRRVRECRGRHRGTRRRGRAGAFLERASAGGCPPGVVVRIGEARSRRLGSGYHRRSGQTRAGSAAGRGAAACASGRGSGCDDDSFRAAHADYRPNLQLRLRNPCRRPSRRAAPYRYRLLRRLRPRARRTAAARDGRRRATRTCGLTPVHGVRPRLRRRQSRS